VGTVDGAARVEAVEVALLPGGELSQMDAKLSTNADANLYCLVCFLRKC
jgi:hypothetical protein